MHSRHVSCYFYALGSFPAPRGRAFLRTRGRAGPASGPATGQPGQKGLLRPRAPCRGRSAGPRSRLTMPRGGAAGRFFASHWRTRPFLSLPDRAPPPGTAHRLGAAGVDGSRRMLMRGRPPQPIGRPRSVGEVSAESQKNRAGPTAACSASGAGRALPARPETRKVSPRQPPARPPALSGSAAAAPGACGGPAPAGGAFVPRSEEARLKGQLLEGLGGRPPPEHPLWSRGKPWSPSAEPSFLLGGSPVSPGKFPRVRGSPGFRFCFIFCGWGYVRSWPLLGENVCLLHAGCNMGGWRRHQSPGGFTL